MDPLSGVWRCQIPVQVKLAENNNSSPTSLPPLYFIVPRQSYLSCLAAQAWPFVQHVLSAIPGQPQRQPWFDYEGIPLRGQFPIGLLYDLTTGSAQHISPSVTNGAGSSSAFGAGSGSSRAFGAGSGCSSALPWQLTLHYSPPVHPHEEALLNTQGAVACAAAPTLFLNSLKEACFICQGSEGSSAAMRMAGGAQGDAMWNSIERGDLNRYRSALSSLRVKPTARQGAPPSIPMRVFVLPPDTDGGTALWDAVIATSRPVPAQTPDGNWTTLGQVLSALLPNYMPPHRTQKCDIYGQGGHLHQQDMSVQEQQRHRQQQQDVQVQQQQEQGHGEAEQGSRKAGERRPHEDSAVGREEAEGPQLLGAEQVSSKAGGCQPQKDSVTGREGAEGHHSPGAETLRGMGGSDGRQRNQGAETKAGDGLRRREKVDDGAGDGHASKLGREAESAVLEAAGEEQTSSIRQGEGGGHGDCGGEGAEGQQEGSAGLAGTETTQAEQSNNLRLQVEKRYQLGSNGEAGEGEGRASVVKHLPEGQGPGQPHLEQAQQPHQDAAQLPNEPFAWTPQSYQPQQQQQQQQQQQCAQAQSAVQQQHFAPRSSLQLLPMVRVDADGRRVGGNGRDVGLDFREGRQKLRALVSGIQPPFDAPIAWLHANMHAPDYFLYVVVL